MIGNHWVNNISDFSNIFIVCHHASDICQCRQNYSWTAGYHFPVDLWFRRCRVSDEAFPVQSVEGAEWKSSKLGVIRLIEQNAFEIREKRREGGARKRRAIVHHGTYKLNNVVLSNYCFGNFNSWSIVSLYHPCVCMYVTTLPLFLYVPFNKTDMLSHLIFYFSLRKVRSPLRIMGLA